MPFVIIHPIYTLFHIGHHQVSFTFLHTWSIPRRSLQNQAGQKKYDNELHRCLKINKGILEQCMNKLIDIAS